MAETPPYLLAMGKHDEFHQAASHVLGELEGKTAGAAQQGWKVVGNPPPSGRVSSG
jgi:hypothetical protein